MPELTCLLTVMRSKYGFKGRPVSSRYSLQSGSKQVVVVQSMDGDKSQVKVFLYDACNEVAAILRKNQKPTCLCALPSWLLHSGCILAAQWIPDEWKGPSANLVASHDE